MLPYSHSCLRRVPFTTSTHFDVIRSKVKVTVTSDRLLHRLTFWLICCIFFILQQIASIIVQLLHWMDLYSLHQFEVIKSKVKVTMTPVRRLYRLAFGLNCCIFFILQWNTSIFAQLLQQMDLYSLHPL